MKIEHVLFKNCCKRVKNWRSHVQLLSEKWLKNNWTQKLDRLKPTLRAAGSNPAGQLLIYFHSVFPVLTKTLCRHSNLVPKSCINSLCANRGVAHPGLRPLPPPPPPTMIRVRELAYNSCEALHL